MPAAGRAGGGRVRGAGAALACEAAADELLASVKGRLHTVKGNSAMMGLAPDAGVAHALEDACGAARPSSRASRTTTAAALLVAGGGLLVDLVRRASPELGPAPATAYVERVRRWLALERGTGDGPRQAERPPAGAERGGRRRGGRKAASVVRVDFRRLDAMLEVLGEGLIQHSALAEAYRELARRAAPASSWTELDRPWSRWRRRSSGSSPTLMETRLLPISTVFGRFPRMVRDMAEAEGKRVRLVRAGGETALDKAVLDRLERAAAASAHQRGRARNRGARRPPAGRASPRRALRLGAASRRAGWSIRAGRRRPRARRGGDPRQKAEALGLDGRRREHRAPHT